MKYFLDFDRTIFDTPSFKKRFMWRVFFTKHGLKLEDLLYPEVPGFLRAHGPDCTIVTYGVRAFIVAKVTNALSGFDVADVVYTSRRKGRVIRRLTKNQPGPFTFVDDMHFQLRSVSRMCPNVKVFEIRRDSRAGDGRWPVIHSLDELPGVK